MLPNVTYKIFVDKMGGTNVDAYIGNIGEMFYGPDGILRLSTGVDQGGMILAGANVSFTIIDGGIF